MTSADDTPDTLAADLLDGAPVDGALRRSADRLASSGVPPQVAEAVVLDAVAREARRRAIEAVRDARSAGVPWADIAQAFGLSTSTVRHRFDAGTIARRREYEERKRSERSGG
jgi:DNA invertase Pin-like site-specific DNA recombinase